ncbi:MAG: hypothetical protein ACYTFW_00965 [Planctomycetota bacterium]
MSSPVLDAAVTKFDPEGYVYECLVKFRKQFETEIRDIGNRGCWSKPFTVAHCRGCHFILGCSRERTLRKKHQKLNMIFLKIGKRGRFI